VAMPHQRRRSGQCRVDRKLVAAKQGADMTKGLPQKDTNLASRHVASDMPTGRTGPLLLFCIVKIS